MFTVHQSDTGAVPSNEYIPAAAGNYEAGEMLVMTGGRLAKITAAHLTTPPYVCAATMTVKAGEPLPVNRVRADIIYMTTLAAAAAAAAPGGKLAVASGGLQVATGAGTFEIVNLEGTAIDSLVFGRFA